MNLGEIIDTIRYVSGRASTSDEEDMIRGDVNRAYRKLCRSRTFGALVHRGEQFTTVNGTMSYVLPYPLERIINDSLRYDVTSQRSGAIVTLRDAGSTERTMASALCPYGSYPLYASISQNVTAENLFSGFFVSVSSAAPDTVTAAGGVSFDASMVGKYIRFGNDQAGKNGGDYGYLITDYVSATEIDITQRTYRGPSLTKATFEIQPVSSKWLFFDPIFSDSSKVVQYDWYSKPQRLYGLDDVPEVEELSDAIVYAVLANNPLYHRPQSYDRLNYVQIAHDELVAACKTGLQ